MTGRDLTTMTQITLFWFITLLRNFQENYWGYFICWKWFIFIGKIYDFTYLQSNMQTIYNLFDAFFCEISSIYLNYFHAIILRLKNPTYISTFVLFVSIVFSFLLLHQLEKYVQHEWWQWVSKCFYNIRVLQCYGVTVVRCYDDTTVLLQFVGIPIIIWS